MFVRDTIKVSMNKCLRCNKEFVITHTGGAKKVFCSKLCRRLEYVEKNRKQIKERRQKHYIANRDKERRMCADWYKKNKESEIAKNKEYRKMNRELFNWYHDKDRFGGIREKILQRDNFQCQICGNEEKLCVHHIDGTNYLKSNTNNDLENLITLCKSCHSKLHWWQRKNHNLKSSEDIVRTMAKVIEARGKILR